MTVVKTYSIVISTAQQQVRLAKHSKSNLQLLSQHSKGVRRGVGGSTPPIRLSTKMHNKENLTFLVLLSLFFFCNDMDSNMI